MRYQLLRCAVVGLSVAAAGLWTQAIGAGAAEQPSPAPCTLVTTEDVQPLAPLKATVAAGVATQGPGFSLCRYTWGTGTGRFTLDVVLNDPARTFAGMGPDAIKKELQSSVRPATADAVIGDVGEAAVFRADSPMYVHATSYVKGRVVRLSLDGFEAVNKKDQLLAVLKAAASRL